MTDLRAVLLHAVLRAGDDASAIEIWNIVTEMTDGHSSSCASLQRNLTYLAKHGVLVRTTGTDRRWRYSVAEEHLTIPAGEPPVVTFVEIETGRRTCCDAPEIAVFLQRLALERGLSIRSAAIDVQATREKTSSCTP